jgi:hypothetical protein
VKPSGATLTIPDRFDEDFLKEDTHMEEDTHKADLPPYPDSNLDTSVRPDRESPPGTPRWVKAFGIISLVLVLLVVLMMIFGVGGEHGPGRHIGSGDPVATHRP